MNDMENKVTKMELLQTNTLLTEIRLKEKV